MNKCIKKKVPFIQQYSSTECGICVLIMILHYYGAYYSRNEVKQVMPVSRDGTSIKMLIDAFGYYGIRAKAYYYDIDKDDIKNNFPVIANWENNHFIIVEAINANGVQNIPIYSKIYRMVSSYSIKCDCWRSI